MEAIHIFAKDFKRKVEESKWYSFLTPPPTHFLQLEYIELSLFLHLHHIKDVYANSKKSQEYQHTRLKSAACSTHKIRLYTSQVDCVMNNDELVVHNDLMQSVGSQGVSSDESDTGLEDHKVYQKISPAWHRLGTDQFTVKSPGGIYPVTSSTMMQWCPQDFPSTAIRTAGWDVYCLVRERNAWADKWYNFESGKIENVIPLPAGTTILEMQVDDENGSGTSTELDKGDDSWGGDSMDEDFTVQLTIITSDEDL
ncbi:hypothetical protein EDD16DRAFT_1526792 [Pisolithus croceorrhizus]|nr:hypothetical protein EDD16DRAFT_1526792 [Pisolithus croceorrhizus]KAI6168253.1 hypothetical protein EDD17DRAFT_1503839 [Pisolithus thermaeus]